MRSRWQAQALLWTRKAEGDQIMTLQRLRILRLGFRITVQTAPTSPPVSPNSTGPQTGEPDGILPGQPLTPRRSSAAWLAAQRRGCQP
jgi:hypothetical protein